ncbi:MAG: glycosyltransferase family 2 protein [Proteobacteria bacterium]|jgi:glycosyltransferase involved in cell wall biosynthesis|nr:glycosyltransferase [Desulfocapsa sp.]MBU3944436.1 glycosyltransferase family 2 protein [Pseudomonadota bacterium]MCG2744309.1 glycosyltransferase family 2 protein [Desulfobacteraceae bacterium]MBU3984357.1 glycosyltransferase family 2 protein [Pseudomonadota bacterium]MBU4028725.1 glycosyltransferase family 2 protein [Pseudomonadota bacterium]
MRTSLIITTYNWKEALELSLLSVFTQSQFPNEIIIADDGSDNATREIVESLAKKSPVPLIHSWQQNKGFRLARSRNKAIAKATGEYLILIDGDIVLEQHFIADHILAAQTGFFVQGSRVLLNEKSTQQALQQKKIRVCLCAPGIENRKNCLRSSLLSSLCSFSSKKLSGIKTCNFAFWKKDAEAVNGFNEEFLGWGREDSEFTARLLNNGIRRQNIRFNALAYHLYHPMNSRKSLPINDAILADTCDNQLVWCDKGLSQHLQGT